MDEIDSSHNNLLHYEAQKIGHALGYSEPCLIGADYRKLLSCYFFNTSDPRCLLQAQFDVTNYYNALRLGITPCGR